MDLQLLSLKQKDTSLRFGNTIKRMARLQAAGQIEDKTVNDSLQSWLGHARHADAWGLRQQIQSHLNYH